MVNLGVYIQPIHTCDSIVSDDIPHIEHFLMLAMFLVENEMKAYLLDPTIIQFFDKITNATELTDANGQPTAIFSWNYYIKNADKPRMVRFINQGFEELDEEMARIYGDNILNSPFARRKEYVTNFGKYYLDLFFKCETTFRENYRSYYNLFLETFTEQYLNSKHTFLI